MARGALYRWIDTPDWQMELSGTDRSAVRLGYGDAFLLSQVPGLPVPANGTVQAGCTPGLSTNNASGLDRSVSFWELFELDPVLADLVLP